MILAIIDFELSSKISKIFSISWETTDRIL